MSRPAISILHLNEHLGLAERHPDSECRTNSWWLYDTRAGMNIGMREKNRDAAFVEAIEYWAARAEKAEQDYITLRAHVDSFVGAVCSNEEDGLDE